MHKINLLWQILFTEDFPGGPVVKNSPSNAGYVGPIPVGELRSHFPQGSAHTRKDPAKSNKYSLEIEWTVFYNKYSNACNCLYQVFITSRTLIKWSVCSYRKRKLIPFKKAEIQNIYWYNLKSRASLVALWIQVCLPMQGTHVGSQLLNSRAAATKDLGPRACALEQEKPPQWEARPPHLESSPHWLQLRSACAAMKTQCGQK